MTGAALCAALCAALSRPGIAQRDTMPPLVGDREASAELAKIVSATRDAGLPIDPILAKVRYGVSVAHAPAPRIVAAARMVASRLETAREALAPRPTSNDIAVGADALAYGATREALHAVRAASRDQSVATPLGVLAQLLASGVPAKRAFEIVTDLMKRGASGPQLVALGNDVNADVASGAQALAALDTRLRGLTAVLAPGGGAVGAGVTAVSGPTGPKKP